MFNVSVDIRGRNITVNKVNASDTPQPIRDIDPHHNITHVVMRQLELIANDLTSYYRSTLGDAFNASISDYRTSVTGGNLSETQIVMKGMENAVTSLVDDLLVGYASAQLVVGEFSQTTHAMVQVSALRVGSRPYVVTSAVITGLIALLVLGEGLRMRWWKGLPAFDYQDNRALIVAASRGGKAVAEYAERLECKDLGRVPVIWRKGEYTWDHGEIAFQPMLDYSKEDMEGTEWDKRSAGWI